MSFPDTISYFITIVAIALAPGPVALMLMVRAASSDVRGATFFGLGFATGGLMIITAVCFGLGAWLTSVPAFFEYSKYLMMAYILFLAFRIWQGRFDMTNDQNAPKTGLSGAFSAGFATCAISPYMMLLFPLVLPGIMDISTIKLPNFAIVSGLTFVALCVGSGIIIVFAAQLRRLVRTPRHAAVLNRVLSSGLVLGGSWMAFG